MSADPGPVDPRIRRALGEGMPDQAPDGLLQAIAERVAGEEQRHAGWFYGLGAPRVAAAAMVAVAVLAVGFAALRLGQSPAPGASITLAGSAVAAPSMPTDGSCEAAATCLGLIAPGPAMSRTFQPRISFTVPGGWMNREDRGGNFVLRPIAMPANLIGVYRAPEPVRAGRVVSGIAQTARALSDWLTADPELRSSAAQQVTVGGLNGYALDVVVAPGADGRSADCPGATCVTFLTGSDPSQRPTWSYREALTPASRARVYLLDAPGVVILVVVQAWDGATFNDLLADAGPIVASFRFGP